jgi:hypothetical protein
MLRPQAVARLVSGTGATPDTPVVRILGGRQLLQGTAVMIRPTPALVTGAAAVAGASAAAGALVLRGARR